MNLTELLHKITPLPWQQEERVHHCYHIFGEGYMPHAVVYPQMKGKRPEDDSPEDVARAVAHAVYNP